MENFDALGLPQSLLLAVEKMGFKKPTPVQAQAIPPALSGRDILGSAQTGTGKTAAFAIPLIAHLIKNKEAGAIVMTPTRELAAQVLVAIKELLSATPHLKSSLLIGGQSMSKQLQQLRARPRIIVGTPGRINDHLQQGTLKLSKTDFLVLDETDRMLDMGFDVQIERIVKRLPRDRQTLLFSATLPARIVKLSEQYLRNPERVAVGSSHTPVKKIKQDLVHIRASEKYDTLLNQLYERTGSIIVFVKTKRGADRIAKKLTGADLSAQAIHGDLNQNKRMRVIQGFRDKKYRIMVATDVAARGLDIPHIEHVINYDLPQCPEDYIHRIGRTARAGASGEAVCFITPEDSRLWREIHFLLHPGEKPPKMERPSGGRGKPRRSASGRPGGRSGNGGGAARPDSKGKTAAYARKRKRGDRNRSASQGDGGGAGQQRSSGARV